EEPVPEVGLDGVPVDVARESEGPGEMPVGALDPVVVAPLLLLLEPPLALQGQQAVLHLDLDLVGLKARQLRGQDDLVLLLADVDRRHPGAEREILVPRPGRGRSEGPVETVGERRELAVGIPANDVHVRSSFGLVWCGQAAFFRVRVSLSRPTVSSAVSPGFNSFFRISAARASETSFWMRRFSGRAPKVGS